MQFCEIIHGEFLYCLYLIYGLVSCKIFSPTCSRPFGCHWYYVPGHIHFRNIIQLPGFMSKTVSHNRVWLYRLKQERQQQVFSLSSKHRQCTNLWTLCKLTAAAYDWAIHTLCWSRACHPANIYLKSKSVQRTSGKEATSVCHSGSTRCDVLQDCGGKHRNCGHNKAPFSHLTVIVFGSTACQLNNPDIASVFLSVNVAMSTVNFFLLNC